MEGTQPHIIPSIYLANYLNDFEELMVKYGAWEKKIEKGSYLTQYGVINNTAYYVKKGIIHLSLGHEQGRKSLNMFGPGTIMFFDSINQTFEPCLARICDILYLYLTKVHPASSRIPMSQTELASLAGASQAQMERSIKILKKEGILNTSRKQITILDQSKLLAHCTLGMRSNV